MSSETQAMQIEIVSRSTMIEQLRAGLTLKPRETAIVTIDMHRGHLDPAVATMAARTEDAIRVIAAAKELLGFARGHNMPIVHVKLVYRRIPGLGSEGMTQPFWRAIHELSANDRLTPGRNSTVNDHNIAGSPGTEIIPELYAAGDYVIDNKKRLDCFYGTDLNQLLRGLGAGTVALMGINTNTCVLNTAFTAFNLDYRVLVLSDCVASMYGEDLHVLGLQNVARCLGWVLSSQEFRNKIEEGGKRND
jgi:nicotinamidase-related amidase